MAKAVVKSGIAPVYQGADNNLLLKDEVLLGMVVEREDTNQPEWKKITTDCGYEGFVEARHLNLNEALAKEWAGYGKMVARAPWVDVMAVQDDESRIIAGIPRGGLVHPRAAEDEGWLLVDIPDGQKGFVRTANLMPHITNWQNAHEGELREALATTALSYLGTQYRFGGRSPLGIDCCGLVNMAYLLNGAVIWRGTELREGYGLCRIAKEDLAMGDLIYFENHVAMYLSDDMYVHATALSGSDGVVLNSLRSDSPFLREDLVNAIVACASLFPTIK